MNWFSENPKDFSALVGKTITEIAGLEVGSDEVVFICESGERYRMTHYQDCCEVVRIEEIVGNVDQILDRMIVSAEESSSDASDEEVYERGTWTFYRINSTRGSVVIRWLGESIGYYSESVDFEEISS